VFLSPHLFFIAFQGTLSLAHLLVPHYGYANNELRALVKVFTLLSIDMIPDYSNNKLYIYLYPPANNRSREAIANTIDTVNRTNTIFPDTNLSMVFNISTF
jgi:hypothetical protein